MAPNVEYAVQACFRAVHRAVDLMQNPSGAGILPARLDKFTWSFAANRQASCLANTEIDSLPGPQFLAATAACDCPSPHLTQSTEIKIVN